MLDEPTLLHIAKDISIYDARRLCLTCWRLNAMFVPIVHMFAKRVSIIPRQIRGVEGNVYFYRDDELVIRSTHVKIDNPDVVMPVLGIFGPEDEEDYSELPYMTVMLKLGDGTIASIALSGECCDFPKSLRVVSDFIFGRKYIKKIYDQAWGYNCRYNSGPELLKHMLEVADISVFQYAAEIRMHVHHKTVCWSKDRPHLQIFDRGGEQVHVDNSEYKSIRKYFITHILTFLKSKLWESGSDVSEELLPMSGLPMFARQSLAEVFKVEP